MNKSLRGGLAGVLLIVAVGILLAGCGNFRQQAQEAQSHLDEVVQQARIAEDAAARNAGRIIELEHRVEALEAALADLQETEPND